MKVVLSAPVNAVFEYAHSNEARSDAITRSHAIARANNGSTTRVECRFKYGPKPHSSTRAAIEDMPAGCVAVVDANGANVTDIKGRAGGGALTGQLKASWGGAIQVSGDFKLDNGRMNQLMPAFTRDFSASGTVSLTANYAFSGATLQTLFDNVRLEGPFTLAGGERVRARAGDTPVLLKIAPDLTLSELDDVVHIARSRKVDGMIVANTTLSRPPILRDRVRMKEQGGLSGRPLFRLSTRMVAETYVRAEGAFPLIGVGGIDSGGAALTKIRAGATLLQLYSALVYKGIGLVDDIKADLASTLLRTGRDSLSEIVGADAATITAEEWPI